MKYRPGDKVKIRNDLVEYKRYGSYNFVPYMSKFEGEQIIKELTYNGYTIKADTQGFKWSDEMFEDIKEDKMDNNTLQINMNNLTDEERNTLLSLVKKSNEPKSKVWKPDVEEEFYTLFGDGSIYKLTWLNIADRVKRYEIGNCFKTEEEAKFALEKLKVITELKRFAIEHNEGEIDWNSKIQNIYCLYYREHRGDIEADYFCSRLWDGVFFTSKKIAEQAIKEIGEERLKKYYFEVND